MGTRSKDSESRLTQTAATLDAEIARFEQLVKELDTSSITSEKTLHRAAGKLEESAAIQQRLGSALQAFAEAMQEMQERQQRCVEATREAAQRVEQRFAGRNALLQRVQALGERAREINAPVAAAMAPSAGEDAAPDTTKVLSSLEAVLALTASAIDEADAVQRAAKDEEWSDIERDTGNLKQQLQSVRNKVLTTQRSVAARAAS